MPWEKDFEYVRLTRELTWELTCRCYGDLWHARLTCITMSETTPGDHIINLCEFLVGKKALAMSNSIRVWVNCSWASVELHLSCTVVSYVYVK